jgi:hypothetical protein
MNTDIRLQMSFYNNTKVKRLYRELGADGPLSVLFLWLYTAENRPHGELRGMDTEDIAIAAQWPGDAEKFVECVTRLKFLDRKGKLLTVHDWESNNPWAFGAPERKMKAAKAAKVKWAKNNEKDSCYEQSLACSPDARSNAPSPLPSPSPYPKEKATTLSLSQVRNLYLKYAGINQTGNGQVTIFQDFSEKYTEAVITEAFQAAAANNIGHVKFLSWCRTRMERKENPAEPPPRVRELVL